MVDHNFLKQLNSHERYYYNVLLAQSWHRVPGKGCFYLDQDLAQGAEQEDVAPIKCHHYQLTLSQPTNIWLEVGVAEPGLLDMDVQLFVCRVNDKEEVTDVITYTQHKIAKVTGITQSIPPLDTSVSYWVTF